MLLGLLAEQSGEAVTAGGHFQVANEQAANEQAADKGERALQREALLKLARFALNHDVNDARQWLNQAEALNPPAYPYLILKARSLAGSGQTKEALAVAFEARESSGDWWQAEDQAVLDSLSASDG